MLANVFLVLPALPFLIVINSYLPAGGKSNSVLLAAIISLTGWAWGARVLRAQTLSMRKRDFVDAARISGERSWRIIIFEIVPNLVPVIAASFVFTVLYAMGTYVALAFIGAIDPNNPWSWGSMLFWAQSNTAAQVGGWYWFAAPGICVALLGTSLVLLNFGIDEFINPRLRAAGLSRKGLKAAGVRSRNTLGLTPVVRKAQVPAATIIEETV
jgi:peptide/nickel transport system permease protein